MRNDPLRPRSAVIPRENYGCKGMPATVRALFIEAYQRLGSCSRVAEETGRSRQAVFVILKKTGVVKKLKKPVVFKIYRGRKYAWDARGKYYRLTVRRAGLVQPLHQQVWLDHHGFIPAGSEIVLASGDRHDVTIGNLRLVKQGDSARASLLRKNGRIPNTFTSARVRAYWANLTAPRRERLVQKMRGGRIAARAAAVARGGKSSLRASGRHLRPGAGKGREWLADPLTLAGFTALMELLLLVEETRLERGIGFFDVKVDVETLLPLVALKTDRVKQRMEMEAFRC